MGQSGLLLDTLASLAVLVFFLWANFFSQSQNGIMPVRLKMPRSLAGYGAVFILISYLSFKYM